MDSLWPYVLLGLLGAYHGLNPAMGWLFAVALGMQERSRRAVLRSLVPIAIGHEASIALVALLVLGLSTTTDPQALRIGATMSPAPCAVDMRNDHIPSSRSDTRIGLQILRRAWLNTDQVWAGAFVLAGLVTLTS